MIEFQGRQPWCKLTAPERAFVNWHRTVIRGAPGLMECPDCDGHGRRYCRNCKGERERVCPANCENILDQGKDDCRTCRSYGALYCEECDHHAREFARCPRCRGDGAIPVVEPLPATA